MCYQTLDCVSVFSSPIKDDDCISDETLLFVAEVTTQKSQQLFQGLNSENKVPTKEM